LIAWFMQWFVPDPARGYGLMHPPGADAKYTKKRTPLTSELVLGALQGQTRRMEIKGKWSTVPVSIAVTPASIDHYATCAILDIDGGGIAAVERVLNRCAELGLWAFAQLGQSERHDGGHLYIPLSQLMPTSLLADLGNRLIAAVGAAGEAFPRGAQILRLPLMMHLHAPGGPRRFPVVLQDGRQIAADDPLRALAELQAVWSPNSPEAITACLAQLPQLARTVTTSPKHKSKVSPRSCDSVIDWYNDHHDVLTFLGHRGVAVTRRTVAVHCPWHDDRSPSLVLWQHSTGKTVCRCFSTQSHCPAAEQPYLDAFNLYCLDEHLSPAEAVQALVDAHQLGERREFRSAPGDRPPACTTQDALIQHFARLDAARQQLSAALDVAVRRRGVVTVINAQPGLGKTTLGAQLASTLHAQEQRVAIVVPRHNLTPEWTSQLTDAYVWRSRAELCTCYGHADLAALMALGYALGACKPGCPYQEQVALCTGKVTIFQHHHLHLQDGALLAGYDVILIDESVLDSLLVEASVAPDQLAALIQAVTERDASDPALGLLKALKRVGERHAHATEPLVGPALLAALAAELDEPLADALTAAAQSPWAIVHPRAPTRDHTHLPPAFFGRMLEALRHDVTRAPHEQNPLVEFGRLREKLRGWVWYERHGFLTALAKQARPPAVIMLDGSANELVLTQLCHPWPLDVLQIEVPLSPAFSLIQVPFGSSTRAMLRDSSRLENAVRLVAAICARHGVVLDGGVTYRAAHSHFADQFGGTWLYFGSLRGLNALERLRTLAIVASPTTPPDVIARKARALWADDAPIDVTAIRRSAGEFQYVDPRLEAINRLHGAEELRQAAYRCRPITCTAPTTLIVFSPWDLDSLGLAPTEVYTEVPHGNSAELQDAFAAYQRCRALSAQEAPSRSDESRQVTADDDVVLAGTANQGHNPDIVVGSTDATHDVRIIVRAVAGRLHANDPPEPSRHVIPSVDRYAAGIRPVAAQ
jgi:hypothetical protein